MSSTQEAKIKLLPCVHNTGFKEVCSCYSLTPFPHICANYAGSVHSKQR